MRERFWNYGKYYFIVLLIVFFSIMSITAIFRDMNGSTTELAAKNLSDDARMFTAHFDDMFTQNFNHLQLLSKRLKETDYLSDNIQAILADYKTIFRSVEIIDLNGNWACGDALDVELKQGGVFDSIVFDKKNVVFSKKIYEQNNEESIGLCVPLEQNDKTTGVLIGTIAISEINELMDSWGYTDEDCAFVVNIQGNCMSSGEKFKKVLGKKTTNYFTCLSNSDLEGEISSISKFERAFLEGDPFPIRYSYVGKEYIGEFYPSNYGSWYIGLIERADSFYWQRASFSGKTIAFLVITFVLWIGVLIFTLYAIYKRVSLQTELERYTIVHNLEQSIICEMQFSPRRLEFFGDTKEMFGVENVVLNGEEVFDIYKYVHEDDQSLRGRLHHFYDEGEESVFTAEIRIKNGVDSYGWYRISGTAIKDKHLGTNIKFVAKIENADQQIAEEKDLVQRAENDLLTGILNKKTMEEKVSSALKETKGNNHCIFFMVDLDNFKNVNDKLGHIYGDKAIVDTAHLLTELFPNNAYVGRLGGDEFAVCAIYDAFDKESMMNYIKKKADKICEVNRRTYVNGNVSVDISSSVGIAIAPDSEQNFETVYKMADSALYRSKNGGKNCYHLYQK